MHAAGCLGKACSQLQLCSLVHLLASDAPLYCPFTELCLRVVRCSPLGLALPLASAHTPPHTKC